MIPMVLLKFSFELTGVILFLILTTPLPRIFFWITTSIADADAMVSNSVSLFLVIGITTSISGPIYLPNEPPGNSHDLINSFRKMYFAKFYVSQGIVNKNFSFFFCFVVSNIKKFFGSKIFLSCSQFCSSVIFLQQIWICLVDYLLVQLLLLYKSPSFIRLWSSPEEF